MAETETKAKPDFLPETGRNRNQKFRSVTNLYVLASVKVLRYNELVSVSTSYFDHINNIESQVDRKMETNRTCLVSH